MILCDCHDHSWFSFDGRGSIEEMCAGAHRAGVSIFALTEHYEFEDLDEATDYYLARQERRLREMKAAKERWNGRVELLCGIEIGQAHTHPEEARALAGCGAFDVVIGSLHGIRPRKDIYRDFTYATMEECDAVYQQYFDEAMELIETGDFDVFGHFDYPLRMMRTCVPEASMLRWKDRMLPFLKALADSGHALEINTSGARRWQGRPGGEQWILEAYRGFGGRRIAVGSDAHRPEDVGTGIEMAYRQLLAGGFDSVTVYRQRRPEQVSIR